MRIFHIVTRSDWAAAQPAGQYLPAGYERDGFVHFSFAEQVEGVANSLYRDVDQLIVVEIESDDVSHELRVEDCYEAGEKFPHIYGAIPTGAVRGMHELARTSDGRWLFSRGPASGPASTDR